MWSCFHCLGASVTFSSCITQRHGLAGRLHRIRKQFCHDWGWWNGEDQWLQEPIGGTYHLIKAYIKYGLKNGTVSTSISGSRSDLFLT